MRSLDRLWRDREARRAVMMPPAPVKTEYESECGLMLVSSPRYWDQPGWLITRPCEEPVREAILWCLWAQWRERLSRKKNTEMSMRTQSTRIQVACEYNIPTRLSTAAAATMMREVRQQEIEMFITRSQAGEPPAVLSLREGLKTDSTFKWERGIFSS